MTLHRTPDYLTCFFCEKKCRAYDTFLGYLCSDCLDRLRAVLKGMVGAWRAADEMKERYAPLGDVTPTRCEHGMLMPECLVTGCAHYRGMAIDE